MCGFVFIIYKYSFRAHEIIINIDFQEKSKLTESSRKELENIFSTISHYRILIIENENKYYNIIKTVYNIVTIWINQRFDSIDDEDTLFSFKRILNIVMTDLNLYRIKYCRDGRNNSFLLVSILHFKLM